MARARARRRPDHTLPFFKKNAHWRAAFLANAHIASPHPYQAEAFLKITDAFDVLFHSDGDDTGDKTWVAIILMRNGRLVLLRYRAPRLLFGREVVLGLPGGTVDSRGSMRFEGRPQATFCPNRLVLSTAAEQLTVTSVRSGSREELTGEVSGVVFRSSPSLRLCLSTVGPGDAISVGVRNDTAHAVEFYGAFIGTLVSEPKAPVRSVLGETLAEVVSQLTEDERARLGV